jgi:hypothetical protein
LTPILLALLLPAFCHAAPPQLEAEATTLPTCAVIGVVAGLTTAWLAPKDADARRWQQFGILAAVALCGVYEMHRADWDANRLGQDIMPVNLFAGAAGAALTFSWKY